jgi:hypothetical protein
MLGNRRGAEVGIPEADAKAILLRRAQAAEAEGHMPPRASPRRRSFGSRRWRWSDSGLARRRRRRDWGFGKLAP